MAAAAESSDHPIVSPPLIDLRLLSQSELHTLSLSSATATKNNDFTIPKIDRSIFNESAGSRKQTYSHLRLAPRDKQNSRPRSSSSSSLRIPAPAPEPLDQDNSKIITLLQELFGVEPLRHADNNRDQRLVPVQVEFKQPALPAAAGALHSVPVEVVDGSSKKNSRKRGRPRKSEVSEENGDAEGKVTAAVSMALAVVDDDDKKGLVVEDVGDPFGEVLIGRTLGLTESQLLEFMEGLKGEWASQRKKRRFVEAGDLCNVLPTGWKLVLSFQRRAGRVSVICRRYISPDGRQFESYKEVCTHLLSVNKNNINMASGSGVDHVTTLEMKTDANASSAHHEKQASIASSIGTEKQVSIASATGTEKLNTYDGNSNSNLASGFKLGHASSGAFRDSDQIEDRQPLNADANANASSAYHGKQASIASSFGTEKQASIASAIGTYDGNSTSNLASGFKLGDASSGAFRDSDQTEDRQLLKTDANASSTCHEKQASIASPIGTEKQASIASAIGTEKLNTYDGNSNSNLASGFILGDASSGAFRDSDQTEDRQPLKTDVNASFAYHEKQASIASSIGTEKQASIASAIGTEKLNTYDGNSNSNLASGFKLGDASSGAFRDSDQTEDKQPLKADKNDVNSLQGCSLKQDREPNQNSAGAVQASDAACNLHIPLGFTSLVFNNDIGIDQFSDEINADGQDRNTVSYETVPCRMDQTHVDYCSMDRTLTSMLKDSDVGNLFDYDLPSAFAQDASEPGGVDFTPSLEVGKDVNDNHVRSNEETVTSCLQKMSSADDQIWTMDNLLDRSSEDNLFALTNNQQLYSSQDNMNMNISAGTFDVLKSVDAGCKEPQLGIVSCSNVVAADTSTSARVMHGISEGCESVPLGGSILNSFDKQSDDDVNKVKTCLSEKAESGIEMFQSDSMDISKFR